MGHPLLGLLRRLRPISRKEVDVGFLLGTSMLGSDKSVMSHPLLGMLVKLRPDKQKVRGMTVLFWAVLGIIKCVMSIACCTCCLHNQQILLLLLLLLLLSCLCAGAAGA
jgi:hypothetical protein